MGWEYSISQSLGVSTNVSAGLWVLTLVTAALFFQVNPRWGRINDIISVLFLVSMIPLAFMLNQRLDTAPGWQRLLFFILCVVGVLIPAYGQTVLVLGRIDFQKSTRYMIGFSGVGIWLIWVNTILLAGGATGTFSAWAGILTGAGIVMAILLFLLKRTQHWLFYLSAGLLVVGLPVWAVALGLEILQA